MSYFADGEETFSKDGIMLDQMGWDGIDRNDIEAFAEACINPLEGVSSAELAQHMGKFVAVAVGEGIVDTSNDFRSLFDSMTSKYPLAYFRILSNGILPFGENNLASE